MDGATSLVVEANVAAILHTGVSIKHTAMH